MAVGTKKTIWQMGLDVKDVLAGLRDIATTFQAVQGAFAQGFTVKIDTQQFGSLIDVMSTGFDELGLRLTRAMAHASVDVVNGLGAIDSTLKNISTTSAVNIGTALASSVKTGTTSAVADINKVGAASAKVADQLRATAAGFQAQYNRLGDQGKAHFDERAGPDHERFELQGVGSASQKQNTRQLLQEARDAQTAFGKAKNDQAKLDRGHERDAKKAAKEQNDELKEQEKTHVGIGLKIGKWVVGLSAGILAYRLMRDAVRLLETQFSEFVLLGIKFTEQQELTRASVNGVLSANYKVVDSQGHVVEGAARIAALQRESLKVTNDITEAAKKTNTTVVDMTDAYDLLTEPASRYKLTTEQVLDLTTKTATAARAVGINAKDAATQLGAILQGKGSESKFARTLGLDKVTIDALAGTPALMDKIIAKMTLLGGASAAMDESLAGVQKRFAAVLGPISASIEAPFFAAFKEFTKKAEAFVESPAGQRLFALIGQTGQGIAASLTAAGNAIAGDGANGLDNLIIGLGQSIEWLIKLVEWLARGTKWVLEFVGANRLLIQMLAGLAVIAGMYNLLDNFAKYILAASNGTGLFAGQLKNLIAWLTPAAPAVTALAVAEGGEAVAATGAAAATGGFALALGALASATVIGGIVLLFTVAISWITRYITQVRLATQASKEFANRDFSGAMLSEQRRYNEGDGSQKADAARRMTSIADQTGVDTANLVDQASLKFGLTNIKGAADAYIALNKQRDEYAKKSDAILEKTSDEAVRLRLLSKERGDEADAIKASLQLEQSRQKQTLDNYAELQRQKERDIVLSRETAPGNAMTGFAPTSTVAANDAKARLLAREKSDAEIEGNIQKLKLKQLATNREIAKQEQANKVDLIPLGVPLQHDEPPHATPRIKEDQSSVIRLLEAQAAVATKQDKLEFDRREINAETFYKRQIAREVGLSAAVAKQIQVRLKNYDEETQAQIDTFDVNEQTAKKKQGRHFNQDYSDSQKELLKDNRQTGRNIIQNEGDVHQQKYEGILLDFEDAQAKRSEAFSALLEQYGDGLKSKESAIIGDVGEKVAADFQKGLDNLKRQRPQDDVEYVRQLLMIAEAKRIQPLIIAHAQLNDNLKAEVATEALLNRQQASLAEGFKHGEMSVNSYVAEVLRLRDAQIANQLAMEETNLALRKQITDAPAGPVVDGVKILNQEQLEQVGQLNEKLALIREKLKDIERSAPKMKDIFLGFSGVLDEVGGLLHVFDNMNESVSHVVDTFSKIVKSAEQWYAMIQKVMAVMAIIKVMQGGKGKEKSDAFDAGGNFTGKTTVTDEDTSPETNATSADTAKAIEGLGKAADTTASGFGRMSGAIGAVQGISREVGKVTESTSAMGKSMGMMGGVAMGAGVAISIASAMFEAAVAKNKKTLKDTQDWISAQLASGAATLGDTQAAMIRSRQSAIDTMQKSKAGRAALKDFLPQLDKDLADFANRVKALRKTFTDKLAEANAGSGPFADFWKVLLDLEKTSKEYVDSFEKDTQDWMDAKAKVDELYKLTLQKTKDNLSVEFAGYEQEAINAALKVIDLFDQHKQLLDQLKDLDDQGKQLDEDRTDLAADAAKAAKDLAKEREDNAKKILDIEQQIRDVIMAAANAEADVRTRGVLEAQSTIGQQKARDISGIRNSAADQLRKLRDNLADLLNADAFNQKVIDTNKAFDKRAIALDKQTAALAKQRAALFDQLAINEAQYGVAISIRNIEGALFDVSGSRLQLEIRRGQAEVQQASVKIGTWREVKKLIDSIDTSADAQHMFSVPPGFPQIKVQIGNVTIDNKDQSSNPATITAPGQPGPDSTPHQGGGTTGGGGGTPGDGGYPADGRD